ncbi:MAG TPA: N-acetylmuramoyl-L-alanine amidase [Mycobacteriales bacterium]|nr:N-acetylmuramoyl-L-alanine amidase [Mycobacteriales bacterium]
MTEFRLGDRGSGVAEIRSKLVGLGFLDGALRDARSEEFDHHLDRAVRGFQQARGLRVDGIVGAETYRCLDEAHWRFGDRVLTYTVNRPIVGDDVATLQQRLLELGFDPGRCDGIFGPATDAALREFQRNVGLRADGTLGPGTLRALEQLQRTVTGGSPSERREEERLRRSGQTLTGRTIVLDPGHGGADEGLKGNGLSESEITLDLASRIEGRLGALGVTTYITRSAESNPTEAERAGFANDVGAQVVVSLHHDAISSPHASGVACYFYGSAMPGRAARSAVGQRLADLIVREATSRTDLVDCRSHPKSWELLRLTRMPAVRLEAGYLSSASDAARLATSEFRDALAEAVVAALQRLYLPEHLDVPTGQFRIAALAG